MFCPKCGSQNSDETRYCRGCGADLGNVLAVVEGRPPNLPAHAAQQIDLFSRGVRGLTIGVGLLIVSGVSFGISIRFAVLGVFALAFAVIFLGTGISRLVQSRGLKRLSEPKPDQPSLPTGDPGYIEPSRLNYETDDLTHPASVTERTTTHLDKKL